MEILIKDHSLLEIIYHHILDSQSYFKFLGFLEITKHSLLIFLSAILVFSVVFYVSRNLSNHSRIYILFEIFIEHIRNEILVPNLGKEASIKYIPFFFTLFLFILFSNLLGLIPFSSTITANISVNLVLAAFIFFLTPFHGITQLGFVNYWKGMLPSGIHPILAYFLFMIEVFGLFTKPFALLIRLFANMLSGHIMIIVFLFLGVEVIGYWSQVFVLPSNIFIVLLLNFFEIFICFLQAYIFTFLSAIFVSLAAKH